MDWIVIVTAVVGAVIGFIVGYKKGGKERVNAEKAKNDNNAKGGE